MIQPRELTERYRLEKILKSGRSGTVLRAVDLAERRPVVLKLLNLGPGGSDPLADAERFLAAAAVLEAIDQPTLPAVLDSGVTTDGSAFLAIELIEGRSFAGLAGTSHKRMVSLAVQALGGLEALAGGGLHHGNLSPDNLVVSVVPEGQRARLLGLGTALFRTAEAAAAASDTARFRAPEELGPDAAAADWRADLYSLALVVAEVLGAEITHAGSPAPQVALPFSFELEKVDALRAILERCLRLVPGERPGSHEEVRRALRLALGRGFVPEPPAAPRPKRTAAPVPASAPPPPEMLNLLPEIDLPPLEETMAEIPAALPAAGLFPSAPPAPEAALRPASPDPRPAASPGLPAIFAPAAAAPPPAEPEEPASVLREIDFASLEAPPPPPPPPVAAPAPAAAPVAGTAVPLWRRPAVLAGAGAAALLLAALAAWLFFSTPAPPPPPAPARATAPPLPPPLVRLETAREALATDDYARAREVLASLSGADQRALPPGACRQLQAIEEAAWLYAEERLPADLAAGLESGTVPLLRQVLASFPAEASFPAGHAELAGDVARARSLVALYDHAEAAANEGKPELALERFASLARLLPKESGAFALRERAAAALEEAAEARIGNGEYAAAVAGLAPLSTHWPDRPGLADRVKRYRELEQAEKEQEALLAAAPKYGSRRKPDEGLALLRAEKPTPHLAARFAEAIATLAAQLAQLDARPPVIELGSRYDLQFFRGTVANLGFRITDDYKVADVRILATPTGGSSRELPYEKQTQSYVVEIPPSLHNNEAFEVVAVATDLSGHETRETVELTRVGETRRLVR